MIEQMSLKKSSNYLNFHYKELIFVTVEVVLMLILCSDNAERLKKIKKEAYLRKKVS